MKFEKEKEFQHNSNKGRRKSWKKRVVAILLVCTTLLMLPGGAAASQEQPVSTKQISAAKEADAAQETATSEKTLMAENDAVTEENTGAAADVQADENSAQAGTATEMTDTADASSAEQKGSEDGAATTEQNETQKSPAQEHLQYAGSNYTVAATSENGFADGDTLHAEELTEETDPDSYKTYKENAQNAIAAKKNTSSEDADTSEEDKDNNSAEDKSSNVGNGAEKEVIKSVRLFQIKVTDAAGNDVSYNNLNVTVNFTKDQMDCPDGTTVQMVSFDDGKNAAVLDTNTAKVKVITASGKLTQVSFTMEKAGVYGIAVTGDAAQDNGTEKSSKSDGTEKNNSLNNGIIKKAPAANGINSKITKSVYVGESLTIDPTGNLATGSDDTYSWSMVEGEESLRIISESNEKDITVEGISVGTAQLILTHDYYYYYKKNKRTKKSETIEYTVTVKEKDQDTSKSVGDISLTVGGEPATVTTDVKGGNWTSEDESIAKVDTSEEEGNSATVTAVAAGETTVTYTYTTKTDGKTYTHKENWKITVTEESEEISSEESEEGLPTVTVKGNKKALNGYQVKIEKITSVDQYIEKYIEDLNAAKADGKGQLKSLDDFDFLQFYRIYLWDETNKKEVEPSEVNGKKVNLQVTLIYDDSTPDGWDRAVKKGVWIGHYSKDSDGDVTSEDISSDGSRFGTGVKKVRVNSNKKTITFHLKSFSTFALSTAKAAAETYRISGSVTNGTMMINGTTIIGSGAVNVNAEDNVTISYRPNDGYHLNSITIDDESIETSNHSDSYEIKSVNGNHSISVTYAKDSDTSTRTTTVKPGDSFSFPTNGINQWQIVNGQYAGNSSSYKKLSDDGMVRVQKNVVPTNKENEFLVYLSVDKKKEKGVTKTVVDEFLSTATYVCGSSTHGSGNVVGSLGTLQGSEKGTGNKKTHIILTYKGTIIGETDVGFDVSNPSLYLKLDPKGNKKDRVYILLMQTNGRQSGSIETSTVELDDEAYKALINKVEINETTIEETNLDKVTDLVGENFTYENIYEDCVDGSAAESNGKITWTLKEKEKPGTIITEEKLGSSSLNTTTWYTNAAELVYKVKFTPTVSTGVDKDGMVKKINDASLYTNYDKALAKVNQSATLSYSVNGREKTVAFPVPEVRGILHDIVVKKTDESGNALEGAEFKLKDSYGNYIKKTEGNDLIVTSDSNGIVRFPNLVYGDYTLEETKAPAGYKRGSTTTWPVLIPGNYPVDKNENYKKLTMDTDFYADNVLWNLENVTNTKSDVPLTGVSHASDGKDILLTLLSLAAVTGLGFYSRKKMKEI